MPRQTMTICEGGYLFCSLYPNPSLAADLLGRGYQNTPVRLTFSPSTDGDDFVEITVRHEPDFTFSFQIRVSDLYRALNNFRDDVCSPEKSKRHD